MLKLRLFRVLNNLQKKMWKKKKTTKKNFPEVIKNMLWTATGSLT